ncbi:MAG: hypothetical protein J6U58_05040 [Bacteroidaceae bacterium]|nr:hypothetical protein [Bacteroidaceae bacterium]
MRNKEEVRLQRVVATVCATIFACFSFFFVAIYQSPLIELVYDKYATGKLDYNNYVVGGTFSILLTLLALWLNKFTKFQREWTATAYLPSALLLAFFTDIDNSLYTKEYDFSSWIIVATIVIVVYLFLAFVLKRVLFEKIKNPAFTTSRMIWRNLVLLVLIFCLTGTLSNGEENFKREALISSLYKKGDIEGAVNVGKLSLHASKDLTTYRAYILAKENMLGEKLFEYPQLYGSSALIPQKEQTSPLVPDSVFTLLATDVVEGESAYDYIKRAFDLDTANIHARDYYLSALLLDKRLPEFAIALKDFYPNFEKLPKHYCEALLLYAHIEMDNNILKQLDAYQEFVERYSDFVVTESKYDDEYIRGNYIRKKFSDTYWWYYLYSY